MWRALRTVPNRSLPPAAFLALPSATRCYSLKSHKIQAIVLEHKRALEEDRDLILKVMGTLPSPREARQFLNRFSAPDPAATDAAAAARAATGPAGSIQETGAVPGTVQSFVDTLLWPTDHVALIKLEGPFDKTSLGAIAKTLVQLQRLGLMSIIMLDNQSWWQGASALLNAPLEPGAEEQSTEARRQMMKDMTQVVEEIERSGGHARPVYEGVFEDLEYHPYDPTGRISEQITSKEITITPGLRPLQSCLKLRQIPVMIPMATTKGSHLIPVQSNNAMVALAKYLGRSTTQGATHGPLVPMRLIVINTTGGIPLTRTNGIQGPTHCFVNLKDEYDTILDDLDNMDHLPDGLARSYRSNLDMIRDSLEYLPPTCSALITSSPSLTVITNLITDKPLFSSTTRGQDPKVMLATTVLRSGLDIFTFRNSLEGLDLKRLERLLESSFGKPLDADGFFTRIQDRTRTVILAGQDYKGAAIVTREGGDKRLEGDEQHVLASVAYLDKFSVAPKSQGIGVADILWKKLTDEFPDLVWRSRSDNPVNKWYFDRADGNIRIPGTNWTVFWYGPNGMKLIRDYIQICRDIPASFRAVQPAKQ